MQVGRVTAVAWPAQRAVAADLARLADRPAEWPGLGLRDPGPLRLIVVPDARLLDSLTAGRAPSWGAAIALPGRAHHPPPRRPGRPRPHPPPRARPSRAARGGRRAGPALVRRGYAAWAAGEWDRLGTLELNLTVVRGAVPTLTGLDGALRGSASSADAAYALAVSAVTELARRNPTGTLTPLLRRLESGEDFDAAVLATTGLAVGRFEQEWQRAVRRRYTLGNWLIAGGGWLVVALLVVVLVRRRRRADRVRRAALDDGWDVEPETEQGPELDPTRIGSSLLSYAQFSPFGDLCRWRSGRAPLPADPTQSGHPGRRGGGPGRGIYDPRRGARQRRGGPAGGGLLRAVPLGIAL